LGVAWIAHFVPFQYSARVDDSSGLAAGDETPTAVQARDPGHDTPLNPVLPAPLGFGVDWRSQPRPSQCSARDSTWSAAFTQLPTMLHRLDAGHDMPSLVLSSLPPGLGWCWLTQLIPFQRKAKIDWATSS
jgi:hypothetical protein